MGQIAGSQFEPRQAASLRQWKGSGAKEELKWIGHN